MAKDKSTKTSKAVVRLPGRRRLGDYLKEQRLAGPALAAAAGRPGRGQQPLPQPDRARPAQALRRGAQQLAKALRVSAEQLYVRAGIVHPDPGQAGSVELAVLADAGLTERQKQSLLDVYASFLALNERDTTQHLTRPPHQKENDMATAKFDIKTEALKPVLAGVGVTDLAVEVVRDAVADVQKRVAAVQKSATRTACRPEGRRERPRRRPRQGRPVPPRRRRGPRRRAAGRGQGLPRQGLPRWSTRTSRPPTPPTPTWSSAASPSWAASAARSRPPPR